MATEGASGERDTTDPCLPIFALNAVLLPGSEVAVRVFEARYLDMMRRCLREEVPFGVCRIRTGREVGAPATFARVGCAAHIVEADMRAPPVLLVRARATQAFDVLESTVLASGLAVARVRWRPVAAPVPVPPRHRHHVRWLQDTESEALDSLMADASMFANRLADCCIADLATRETLLSIDDGLQRLDCVSRLIEDDRS